MAASVRTAIVEVLAADSGVVALLPTFQGFPSIFHYAAPQDAAMPFILVHQQSGIVEYSFGDGLDHLDDEVWTVKAIDRNDTPENAEAIDRAVRAALHDAALDVAGYGTLWCRREGDVYLGEVEEGELIAHVGAMYRIIKEPT